MTDHDIEKVDPLDVMSPDEARDFETAVLENVRASLPFGRFGGRVIESIELVGRPGRGQIVFRYMDEVFGGPFEARGEIWVPGGTIEVVSGGRAVVNPPDDVGGWVMAGFRAWDFPAREIKD